MSTTSIFNEKLDYLYLQRTPIMKLFLNKAFLTEGSDRSWPRGLGV